MSVTTGASDWKSITKCRNSSSLIRCEHCKSSKIFLHGAANFVPNQRLVCILVLLIGLDKLLKLHFGEVENLVFLHLVRL